MQEISQGWLQGLNFSFDFCLCSLCSTVRSYMDVRQKHKLVNGSIKFVYFSGSGGTMIGRYQMSDLP